MTKKDDGVFIGHILESINAIQEFSRNINFQELSSNRMKQSAIVREIEIIGEASKNLSKNMKEKYNEIPWKDIVGTRDRIVHQYFGVDLDIVFEIVKNEVPKLKKQMERIKKDIMNKER